MRVTKKGREKSGLLADIQLYSTGQRVLGNALNTVLILV